ncbi:MAG: LacI family transcriptional regulator [Frankiales bacterium]|nr:LacI family transcriptional regulator [Frankiales bacterium]
MRVTITDVAAHAGVSKTTVSRVLNGRGELHEATASRVRRAMTEMGYRPSARGVASGRARTGVLGVLVPSLAWPWVAGVLPGAVEVLDTEDYGLVVFSCNRHDESLRRFSEHLRASTFDGILVVSQEGTTDYIGSLHTRSRPIVVIDDRENEGAVTLPSVSTTNRAGAADLAAHLLSLGRTRPLIVSGPERFGCCQERTAGFAEVYTEAGFSPYILPAEFTAASGRAAVELALADGVVFDAVFAHNDLSAVGAVDALREAGLTVPDDVAVAGFDDVPLAAERGLTSVRQPLHEMGRAAATMLLDRLTGNGSGPHSLVIPTALTIRASTGG